MRPRSPVWKDVEKLSQRWHLSELFENTTISIHPKHSLLNRWLPLLANGRGIYGAQLLDLYLRRTSWTTLNMALYLDVFLRLWRGGDFLDYRRERLCQWKTRNIHSSAWSNPFAVDEKQDHQLSFLDVLIPKQWRYDDIGRHGMRNTRLFIASFCYIKGGAWSSA